MSDEWFASWFDAPYYPLLYQHRDYNEAAGFLEKLVQQLSLTPGSEILDLACGRGRHSLALHHLGFSVTGLDYSKKSIEEASNYSTEGLSFIYGDMRIPLEGRFFDLILNLFTSFGYFESKDDNLLVLRSVRQMLKPGGTFILDYLNPAPLLKKLVTEETRIVQDVRFKITRRIEENRIIKLIDIQDDDNTFTFQEKVDLLTREDFTALFQAADLKPVLVWGDYSGNPYTEESPRQIYFCTL